MGHGPQLTTGLHAEAAPYLAAQAWGDGASWGLALTRPQAGREKAKKEAGMPSWQEVRAVGQQWWWGWEESYILRDVQNLETGDLVG